jgi:hypothetical protein
MSDPTGISGAGANRDLANNPESNTQLLATTGTGRRTPTRSRVRQFAARVERKIEKGLEMIERGANRLMCRDQGEGQEAAPRAGQDIISMRPFKTALEIAGTLVSEPFKGPAEVLLKVADVIEVRVTSISVACTFLTNYIEG